MAHNRTKLLTPQSLPCLMSASYFDILLNRDINGKLTTELYEKRNEFKFSIVNFPYLCSNIPSSVCNSACICSIYRTLWLNQPHSSKHLNNFKCTPHKLRSTLIPTHIPVYIYIYPGGSRFSKQFCACLCIGYNLIRSLENWFWLVCLYEIDIWTTSLVIVCLILWE